MIFTSLKIVARYPGLIPFANTPRDADCRWSVGLPLPHALGVLRPFCRWLGGLPLSDALDVLKPFAGCQTRFPLPDALGV